MKLAAIVPVVMVAASAVLLVYRTAVWREAEGGAIAAEADAAAINRLAISVTQLRLSLPTTGLGERPDEDVMQIAQRAARDSALPASVVREVTPLGERISTADSSLTIQSTRLVVEPVTLQELGTFLRVCFAIQRVWSVQRLDLSAVSTGGAPARLGEYRAVLSLSAEYSHTQSTQTRPGNRQ